jgi:hypothetical protein
MYEPVGFSVASRSLAFLLSALPQLFDLYENLPQRILLSSDTVTPSFPCDRSSPRAPDDSAALVNPPHPRCANPKARAKLFVARLIAPHSRHSRSAPALQGTIHFSTDDFSRECRVPCIIPPSSGRFHGRIWAWFKYRNLEWYPWVLGSAYARSDGTTVR